MNRDDLVFKEVFDKKNWLDYLNQLPKSSPFSTWTWGEYKQRVGWDVHRISVWDKKKNSLFACFQFQEQSKFGFIRIFLIQGGIHLYKSSDNDYHELLESIMIKYVLEKKNVIILINHQSGSSQDIELGLLRSSFTPILNKNSYTYVLDSFNNAIKGEALSKNWTHNLKRAMNNTKLTYHWVVEPSERKLAFGYLEEFYANLMSRKQFGTAINIDLSRDLIINNDEFKIIEARLENKVVAVRIGLFCKDNVLDFLASSSELAKNTYANYLLLFKLIELANLEGKSYFDCGGINPSENMGVFNFKKGLGGRLAVNGPIWLNASGLLLKRIAKILFSING
jgi:hypothetical protein